MKKPNVNSKAKKIFDITVTAIQIAIVLAAVVISAIVIANPIVTSTKVAKGKIKLLPVLTNSMAGDGKDNFKKGDLIIAREPKDGEQLEIGQIITFPYTINGEQVLVTHRIKSVDKNADGKAETYITHGDSVPDETQTQKVNPRNVQAVFKRRIKGAGKPILWLQNPTHFLLAIVLPLLVLFIYNVVLFVMMIIQSRNVKLAEATAKSAALDEEEIKKRAVEEYLASKQAEEASEKKTEDNTNKSE